MRLLNYKSDSSIAYFIDSLLNSYSQIFFSTYKPFAILILVVSFFDYHTGFVGLLGVLATSVTAFLLHLDKPTVAKGLYGFNSLLVGLGLGMYYSLSIHLVFLVVLSGVLTLFIAVALQGVIGKYHLPFLSIPFLLGFWTFTLATKHFEVLGISERGIYTINELYVLGGSALVQVYEAFNNLAIPEILKVYFISLSAILFQYNVLAGMVLAIGLLLFSRIAFSLSLIGFFIAFGFYTFIDANITMVDYSYIGFNYILTAIAIGGFFLVPSTRSYLSMVVLIPLVAVLTISLNAIFITFGLAIYSLPFNVVVLLFLYVLKFRTGHSQKLSEVYYQFNTPEKNLYTFINHKERFKYLHHIPFKLPFHGVWSVSQGHDGEYTHQKEWQHAWDFVLFNKQGGGYVNQGLVVDDYLCFNKPVLAPERGEVVEVINTIADNAIGDVNLTHNWGNTIIVKHSEYVYSKLSHLKQGSITVKKGDEVSAGQVIGKCGNSGRSPYPHLHFQVQAYPYVGSVTLDYPFGNYILHADGGEAFMSHQKPQKDDLVSNIEVNSLLDAAFHLVPGQILRFDVNGAPSNKVVEWEVHVNVYNQTYLRCDETGSKAFFVVTDTLFYFSHFEGRKGSFLHDLFLGIYKVQKGFYKDLKLKDNYPLHWSFKARYLWLYDFISPFVRFLKANFSLSYASVDDDLSPSKITLLSKAENCVFNKVVDQTHFKIEVTNKGLNRFVILRDGKEVELKRNNE